MSLEHQEVIIRAAQKLFSAFGYSKVTMEEIAAEIGASKSVLYYHFTDKDALFKEVLLLEQSDFFKRLEQLHKQSVSAQEQFRQYFQLCLDLIIRLQNLGLLDNTQPMKPQFRPLFSDFREKHQNALTLLLRNDAFISERIDEISDLILDVLQGLRMRQRTLNTPIDKLTNEILLLSDVILNGIIRRSLQ